jgi:hypothetical protein
VPPKTEPAGVHNSARPDGLITARKLRLESADVSSRNPLATRMAVSNAGTLSAPVRPSKLMVVGCPTGVRTLTLSSCGTVTVRTSVVVTGGVVLQRAPADAVQSQVSVLVLGSGLVKMM